MENLPLTEDGIAIILVASDEALRNAVAHLQQHQELALDLEFDQNRYTYGFNLCLIQIADGNGTCYIIDPFYIDDLSPLFAIIENPAIAKIIHHSNNDILLLDKLGCHIKNVVDTDVAAKVINYERSSLATVLKEEFNTEIDKSQQSSNWNKRPLTEDQLRYAAIDVIYLHKIKAKLLEAIEKEGRSHWLEEENHLLEQLKFTEPENPHLRLKQAFRLNYYQQYILKGLYAFRDELAQEFNKPAPYVIPNDALVDLANNPNADIHEWLNHTKGIHGGLKKPKNERLLKEALENTKKAAKANNISDDYPEHRFHRPMRTPETERRKELLTEVQQKIVAKYGEYASKLIINQSLITDYSQTGRLRCSKKYATDIVLQTASELGIDIPVMEPAAPKN
ncbi:HRDC domain-containing protein [Pontibacter sp. JH31]|uniref:HRDC domain-containing protein n=1 Tax=Pontibacter aquaedesilientis TaxID=2766980 RepID=A0ABR7XK51_9BACT|nr:HRDC domain-containing protein [Pontibacter aquaedesilientis]MBD1398652.1 HRDC domain-containing protein [Pontibacter aquaedesilientis]